MVVRVPLDVRVIVPVPEIHVDVDIAHVDLTATVYLHIQLPESSAYHAPTLEREPGSYTPAVRLRLEMGRYVLAEDYARATRGRDVLTREVDAALHGLHALMLPTLPIPAPGRFPRSARISARSRRCPPGDTPPPPSRPHRADVVRRRAQARKRQTVSRFSPAWSGAGTKAG